MSAAAPAISLPALEVLERTPGILRGLLALFRSGAPIKGAAELEKFERERKQTVAWLRSFPSGAGERAGRHEELGTITVAQLMNEFAFHDLGHIRQVAELYRSRVFYPRMGPYQNYYKINP
ncbi:MAG: hypothetical protein HY236_03855 [Acidobacteria bacterium]|nr:hypothetical protein [Acidobacteriota bacterium]